MTGAPGSGQPPDFPFPVCPGVEPPAEYAQMRQRPELRRVVLHGRHEALLVTGHEDVRLVLTDRRFSRGAFGAGPLFARTTESLALVASDPPVHTRRRAAVAHAFTARRVQALRPLVAEVAKRQVEEFREAGSRADAAGADLIGGYSVPLAMRVMSRIVGVPQADLARLKQWVDPMMSVNHFPPETVAWGHEQLHAYFAALVQDLAERPEGPPAGSLIADLLRPGGPELTRPELTRPELVTMVAGTYIAGYETTGNVMGAAVYALLRRPELVARLRREPDLLAPVTEELLRYLAFNGAGGPPHVATAEVTLSDGTVIKEGEVVVPVLDAANRDPAVFDDPDTLQPDRTRNPHVTFGYGPHYCLGAELARIELQVGISTLLDAFPGLRVAVPDDQLRWRAGMFIRGLWELPVRW